MNNIDVVKEIEKGMLGVGGLPSNQEFYDELSSKVRLKLCVKNSYELDREGKVMTAGKNYFQREISLYITFLQRDYLWRLRGSGVQAGSTRFRDKVLSFLDAQIEKEIDTIRCVQFYGL